MTATQLFMKERHAARERQAVEAGIIKEVYHDILADGYNHTEAVEILLQYKNAILEAI